MRYFSKYISAALMLILAVACNTKEIVNPDNPDKPQISDNIKIAASIKQTRVSYSVDNNKLVPDWEKDDVIFGYYGTGDGSRIVFTVTGVDETTGIASLAASDPEWEAFLAEYKTAGENLKVGLIYAGTKETDKDILFANGNSVSVTMTSQTGENIPACMHATSFETAEDDEGQIIRFLFDNDCAIFEIESLTGIAEDAGLTDGQTLSLTSLTVTNLIPTYEYSYASGALSFQSGTGDPTSYTINLPEDTWQVDYEGNINRSADKNLLVAVAPNSEEDILITATATDGMNSREFSYLYNGNLDAGECYIIKKRDVVAKTEDGQYFTSVSAAFDHAEELSGRYTTAADNVVTLIKKEINGFGEQTSGEPHMSGSYDIDYNVTLDLNGCTLSLDRSEGFYVNYIDFNTPATFTITDSNGLNADDEYAGSIESTSDDPIIINLGTVIIDGGNLIYTCSEGIYVPYCMIDNSGSITINNDSYLESGLAEDEDLEEGSDYFIINNIGTLEVNTGYLYSYDGIASIGNSDGGTVTMSGGEVYSKEAIAIKNDSSCIIEGGQVDSKSSVAVSNSGSLKIYGGSVYSEESYAVKSEGGSITIDQLDNTVVTSVYTKSEKNPAIYVTDDGSNDGSNTASFTMKDGTVEGMGYFEEVEDEDGNKTGEIIQICGAIELEGDVIGSISGGSIIADNTYYINANYAGYALYVHDGSTCTISGGEVTSQSDFLPSVFCYTSSTTTDGTSLTVSSGTITGYAGGVALEGKVTGAFTGGEVDTFSKDTQNAGCTVLVDNGSVCTISGGKYYNAGKNNPTIRAIGKNGAGTKLTINWPGSDITVGEAKHEPLIYVSSTNQTCVDAFDYHGDDSYATVKLLGGYFFINTSLITYNFYKGSRTSNLEDFGYIYTNQTRIYDDGTTYNLMPTSGDVYNVNGKRIKAAKEGTSGISVSCPIGGTTKTIKFTYHVAPEGQ